MSTILYMFNGVNLRTATGIAGVTCTLSSDGIESQADLAEQEVPRRQGSVVQASRKKSRVIKISGELGGSASSNELQTALDTLKGVLFSTKGPQALYAGRDDRYWLAQCESFTDSYNDGKFYGTLATVTMSFRAADPDAYGSTGVGGIPALTSISNAVTLATSGATTVTPAGDSEAHPVWLLTVNATATGSVVVANSLTRESCTVTGSFNAGDVITLDSRDASYGVYVNGTVNYGVFSGSIPRLSRGANAINLTLTGLTLSAASLDYIPRYS